MRSRPELAPEGKPADDPSCPIAAGRIETSRYQPLHPDPEAAMKAVRLCLVVAASILPTAPALADEPPDAGRRITVVASPAIIPPGTRCRVDLIPEAQGSATVELTYEAQVVAADDDGLTLTVFATRRTDVYNAGAARLPLVGRLFTNIGIDRPKPGEEQDVRIPAEKIRSVELARE
jgi:hypothetical protein